RELDGVGEGREPGREDRVAKRALGDRTGPGAGVRGRIDDKDLRRGGCCEGRCEDEAGKTSHEDALLGMLHGCRLRVIRMNVAICPRVVAFKGSSSGHPSVRQGKKAPERPSAWPLRLNTRSTEVASHCRLKVFTTNVAICPRLAVW